MRNQFHNNFCGEILWSHNIDFTFYSFILKITSCLDHQLHSLMFCCAHCVMNGMQVISSSNVSVFSSFVSVKSSYESLNNYIISFSLYAGLNVLGRPPILEQQSSPSTTNTTALSTAITTTASTATSDTPLENKGKTTEKSTPSKGYK